MSDGKPPTTGNTTGSNQAPSYFSIHGFPLFLGGQYITSFKRRFCRLNWNPTMGRSALMTATFVAFMAWTTLIAISDSIPANSSQCKPIALVKRRSTYSSLLRQPQFDVSLQSKDFPALSQMALFKNRSYIEMDTCPCNDSGPVYSLLYRALQRDSVTNVLCKPKISCTFDRDRHPPVLYHINCGVSTTSSDPFTCESIKFPNPVYVLRRKRCTDSESETWKAALEENFYVGCKAEIGNTQTIEAMWKPNC